VSTRKLTYLAWAAAACVILALPARAQEPDLSKATRITVAQLKELRAAGKVLVVDVRDAASFKAAHIPGAVSIPLDQVAAKADTLKAEGKTIVTYCA
jgi:3-mercaptopyruvate sulfurtransferase SseA